MYRNKTLTQKKKIVFNINYNGILKNKKWNLFYSIIFIFLLNQIFEIIYKSIMYSSENIKIDIICIFIYYILINTNIKLMEKQKLLNEKIEILKFYNRNLVRTYDDVRAFKHDFNNIMQAIGGYIKFNDFDGLKEYYKDMKKECKLLNRDKIF